MQALQPLGGRRPSACLSTCTSEASISSLDDGQDARAPGPNPADDPPGGGGGGGSAGAGDAAVPAGAGVSPDDMDTGLGAESREAPSESGEWGWFEADGGQMLAPIDEDEGFFTCLLYTSPSPRDRTRSRMPSSA